MNRLRPLGAVKGLAEPPHRAELRVALLHQLVAVQGGWGQASGLGSGFVSFTRARPPTAGAGRTRRHEGTKRRRHEETEGGRRWGALRVKPPTHRRRGRTRRHEGTKRRRGEALGCTPCEAAHPPPARDAHEGTKARRDRGGRLPPALLSPREPAHPPPARAHTKARRHEEMKGGRRWGALRVKLPTHRRRGAHTKARRDGGTKRRRGEALGCTPCEAAHPFLPSTAYLPGRPPYLTPLKGEAPRTPVPGVRSCDPAGSRGACAQRGVARLYSRGSKRTSRSARVSWWPPSGVAVRTSVARCCLRAWSWRMRSSTVWRVMRL